MIISNVIGGLGNQMFQYAIGRALSLRRHTQLKLDISGFSQDPQRKYDLHLYNIQAEIATLQEVEKLKGKLNQGLGEKIVKIFSAKSPAISASYLKEKDMGFHPEILEAPDNVYLEGYWQSEKYFSDIAATIRKDFSMKTAPNIDNQKVLDQIHATTAISLHVRRGDYVSNTTANAFHGTTTLDYYKMAIDKLNNLIPGGTIFVFSDDQTWVKENLKFTLPTIFVDCNDTDHAQDDLRLMASCQHHILANSTFSWWGAWLAEHPKQIVIAPKQWFKNPNISSKDLIPSRWMQI